MKFLFAVLFMSVSAHIFAQDDSVRFITSDVDLFWKKYDLFWKDTTANTFETYIAEGTPALKEFFRYDDAAKMLKRAVREEREYYDAIRKNAVHERVSIYKDSLHQYFEDFRSLYPHAVMPTVYFVVGMMNRGGTASEHGIMLGTERFADSVFANKKGWQTIPVTAIPRIMARCMVFYHQRPAYTGWTLLRQAIVQGSAEFTWSLFLSGERERLFNTPHYQYGEAHEELLVKEFLARQHDSDMSGWFYEGKKYDRPDEMGSWIGFRITEAYYNNTSDKVKALDEIFKINDFDRFLLLSGYAEPFRR